MEIQNEIDKAIASGSATFEVSERTEKLILSVKEGSELIVILDQLFGSSKASLVPSASIRGSDAIPFIKVGGYHISPSVFQHDKRIKNGYHIYQFDDYSS